VARVWVGIDAGRQSHHAAAVDEHGQVLWSMRVSNDQNALTELLDKVGAGDEISWAVDLIGCETALLRAVSTVAGHQVIYVPGRTVKTMTGAFAGEAKTTPATRWSSPTPPGCVPIWPWCARPPIW
jgi:hypothetical protein